MHRYDFLNELNDLCESLFKTKERVLVCITGKGAVGKSTLGKHIRKNGFGDFSKYSISVIDNGTMSLDLFYIFNKRVKIKTIREDELAPFIKLLPKRKKLIFCIEKKPAKKIKFADIVIHLELKDEDERINRLRLRNHKGNSWYPKDSLSSLENVKYNHLMHIKM